MRVSKNPLVSSHFWVLGAAVISDCSSFSGHGQWARGCVFSRWTADSQCFTASWLEGKVLGDDGITSLAIHAWCGCEVSFSSCSSFQLYVFKTQTLQRASFQIFHELVTHLLCWTDGRSRAKIQCSLGFLLSYTYFHRLFMTVHYAPQSCPNWVSRWEQRVHSETTSP